MAKGKRTGKATSKKKTATVKKTEIATEKPLGNPDNDAITNSILAGIEKQMKRFVPDSPRYKKLAERKKALQSKK